MVVQATALAALEVASSSAFMFQATVSMGEGVLLYCNSAAFDSILCASCRAGRYHKFRHSFPQ